MSRKLTEAKVLKTLEIPDFRHMTKDKIGSFVSMLPNMDPEVAKKALDQFPEFANTTLAITENLKASIEKMVEGNSANMTEFNTACRSMLDALEVELHKEGITPEEKANIIEHMTQVLEMMFQKDSENKEFLGNTIRWISGTGIALVFSLACALGIKASADWNARNI